MLEEIYIGGHSRGTCQEILQKRPKELDLLLITNHDKQVPEGVLPLANEHLHLVFDDIIGTSPLISLGHYILPTEEHVKQALDWAEGRQRILVACHAGRSRSSALAYLIACKAWDPKTALCVLKPGTHTPNPHMIQLGAKILGQPIEIWDIFREWYNGALAAEEEDTWDNDPNFKQK